MSVVAAEGARLGDVPVIDEGASVHGTQDQRDAIARTHTPASTFDTVGEPAGALRNERSGPDDA